MCASKEDRAAAIVCHAMQCGEFGWWGITFGACSALVAQCAGRLSHSHGRRVASELVMRVGSNRAVDLGPLIYQLEIISLLPMSTATAESMITSCTVAPSAGDVRVVEGGVRSLFTVTATTPLVATFPAAS